MSDTGGHTPLQTIEALEAAAFRTGQALRQVLAEHPELPIRALHPYVHVSGYLDEEATTRASVEISTHGVDGVHAWAQALGGEPVISIHGDSAHPFEHAELKVTLGGTEVRICGTRRLTDAAAALDSEKDQAPAAGGDS